MNSAELRKGGKPAKGLIDAIPEQMLALQT